MRGFLQTVIPRGVWDPGGFGYNFLGGQGKCQPLPPNVACVEVYIGGDDKRVHVTWDEIMERRLQRQAERMERIRLPAEPTVLPCYVWTFLVPGDFYSGWYCYVVTRHFADAVNFRGFDEPLALSIMNEIPLGFLPHTANFDSWMPAFAAAYPRSRRWPNGKVLHRGKRDPRKAGTFHGWLTARRTFSIQHPNDLC